MLNWSHTATSNTSSGLEPTRSALALHRSTAVKDMWRIDGAQIGDYQDLPDTSLWVIYHRGRCTACETHQRLKWKACVSACVWGASLLVPCCVSAQACCTGTECVITASLEWVGAGGGEWLREIREAVISECCPGHVFSVCHC